MGGSGAVTNRPGHGHTSLVSPLAPCVQKVRFPRAMGDETRDSSSVVPDCMRWAENGQLWPGCSTGKFIWEGSPPSLSSICHVYSSQAFGIPVPTEQCPNLLKGLKVLRGASLCRLKIASQASALHGRADPSPCSPLPPGHPGG